MFLQLLHESCAGSRSHKWLHIHSRIFTQSFFLGCKKFELCFKPSCILIIENNITHITKFSKKYIFSLLKASYLILLKLIYLLKYQQIRDLNTLYVSKLCGQTSFIFYLRIGIMLPYSFNNMIRLRLRITTYYRC